MELSTGFDCLQGIRQGFDHHLDGLIHVEDHGEGLGQDPMVVADQQLDGRIAGRQRVSISGERASLSLPGP